MSSPVAGARMRGPQEEATPWRDADGKTNDSSKASRARRTVLHVLQSLPHRTVTLSLIYSHPLCITVLLLLEQMTTN